MIGGEGLESLLLKGIVIGVLFGMPIGAVGALTTQRVLVYGTKAGMMSGLGSSFADCLYACAGVFGMTVVSDILIKNQFVIHFIGGVFIFLLGVSMIEKRAESINVQREGMLKMFLSSFLVGITNPAAILTFLFAFSYFEIPSNLSFFNGSQIVLGVFIGTLLWWIFLAVMAGVLKNKRKETRICQMSRIFGVLLILFSATVIIKGIMNHK